MIIKVGNFECTEVWDGVFIKSSPVIRKSPIGNLGQLLSLSSMSVNTAGNDGSNVKMQSC